VKNLCVIGQGIVGLPLALRAVRAGYRVVGYDTSEDLTAGLRRARPRPYGSGAGPDDLHEALRTGRYTASSDPQSCAGFEIAVITVPTPLRDGAPDLTSVRQSATLLARFLRPSTTVVLESTSYPGTTEDVVAPILEHGSGLVAGTDFSLGYSPERIDPGNDIWRLHNTPKVVSGVNDTSLGSVASFYRDIVSAVVPVSTPRVAELCKLVENTFRYVNIAFVNELAVLSHELDIDVWEALDAAATKPFGFLPFTPGPGVGGHCLPIDAAYLSWVVERAAGRRFQLVELASDINRGMPDYVVSRLAAGLNDRGKAVNGSRVLLLGLAYKANVADARESPAYRMVELLLRSGAEVRVADPYATDAGLDARAVRVDATKEEVARADAVILVTDHEAFEMDALAAHASYLLDCRHRVTGPNVDPL
jgi:UDP-N-acetyl-D-glucosamine dehydrogenase